MRSILYALIIILFLPNHLLSQEDTIPNHSPINYGFSGFFVTKYIPKSGTQIGEGPANQFLSYITYRGFTGYVWINYGFPDKSITEMDLALFYDFMISENLLNGSLSGNIGFVEWIFPVWGLKNEIIEGNLRYHGWLNANLLSTTMLPDKDVEFGSRIHLKISKDIRFTIGKAVSTISPLITSAYHWNFYEMWGLAFITPGLEYTLQVNSIRIQVYLNSQFSTQYIPVNNRNFLYSGMGIMLDF